jgi:hypothetical protein
MDVVQTVIKQIVLGDGVRVAMHGDIPIFSLSQVLNLVTGRESSNAYGGNYVNTTIRDKFPNLHTSIIPYKFGNQRPSACMDMFNILKVLATVRCEFTACVNELATNGILMIEAGDKGLMEYIACNAGSNSDYHKKIRQIINAERDRISSSANQSRHERFQVDDMFYFVSLAIFSHVVYL